MENIVVAARGWLGTRFHHQGRLKAGNGHAGGCDCLGLLVGVADELDLRSRKTGKRLTEYDMRDYGHIPDGNYLRQTLDALFHRVEAAHVMPGDILLMRFEETPQHVAIVSDHAQGGLGMIHALAAARKVVEHRLDESWAKRITNSYRI